MEIIKSFFTITYGWGYQCPPSPKLMFVSGYMKVESEPGFITFRAINNERAAMAICSGVRPTTGCNTEHVSLNPPSHFFCQSLNTENDTQSNNSVLCVCVCVSPVLYRRRWIFLPWPVWGLPIIWLGRSGNWARLERYQRDDWGCCFTFLPLRGLIAHVICGYQQYNNPSCSHIVRLGQVNFIWLALYHSMSHREPYFCLCCWP